MDRGPDYQKERGARQMERILEALAQGPLTVQQLSERMHLARANVSLYLRRLYAEPKRVRITGFIRTAGVPAILHGLGAAPDEKFIKQTKPRKGGVAARQQARILELIEERPLPVQQLSARVGITDTNIREHLRSLRADKKVYISEWVRSRGNPVPLYSPGKKADAPKPGRQPRKAYRAKVRAKTKTWAATLFAPHAEGSP